MSQRQDKGSFHLQGARGGRSTSFNPQLSEIRRQKAANAFVPAVFGRIRHSYESQGKRYDKTEIEEFARSYTEVCPPEGDQTHLFLQHEVEAAFSIYQRDQQEQEQRAQREQREQLKSSSYFYLPEQFSLF